MLPARRRGHARRSGGDRCPQTRERCWLLSDASGRSLSSLVSFPRRRPRRLSRGDLKKNRLQPRDAFLYVPLAADVIGRRLTHSLCQSGVMQETLGRARNTLDLRINQDTVYSVPDSFTDSSLSNAHNRQTTGVRFERRKTEGLKP